MKVLLINSSDENGGAAKASFRLLQGMLAAGVEAHMLVHKKSSAEPHVSEVTSRPLAILQSRWEKYELMLRGEKPVTYFSLGHPGNDITSHPLFKAADIIHLHWCNRGLLSIKNIERICASGKKVFWTLHDSWAFTGGCHLPYQCRRYEVRCGLCPALSSTREHDLSSQIFEEKLQSWKGSGMQLITPSSWLADSVRKSAILGKYPVRVIPNAIDTAIFTLPEKISGRTRFNLPYDKKIILFGSVSATTDPNKGFDLLTAALRKMADADPAFRETHALCVFGADTIPDPVIPSYATGSIKEEKDMAELYASADVFVLPSRSENLPFTIMESLCCGTPAVAFDVGGIKDLISHGQNGYLVRPYDVDDLQNGIMYTLAEIPASSRAVSSAAGSRYSYEAVTSEILSLYRS